MSETTDFSLSQYFDEQLSPAERDAFEADLREDEALRADLQELDQLRGLLQANHQREVASADFSGFMAAIEAQLPAAPDPAPAPRAAPQPQRAKAHVWAGLRRYLFPVLLGAGAALVVVLVMNRPAEPPPQVVAQETSDEVTVKAVHNQGNQTVLISLPAEDGGATVIWMLDEEEEGEAATPLKGEDPI